MNFENFEDVWRRVTAHSDDLPQPEAPKPNSERKKSIPAYAKSRAVRFIPK